MSKHTITILELNYLFLPLKLEVVMCYNNSTLILNSISRIITRRCDSEPIEGRGGFGCFDPVGSRDKVPSRGSEGLCLPEATAFLCKRN